MVTVVESIFFILLISEYHSQFSLVSLKKLKKHYVNIQSDTNVWQNAKTVTDIGE